MTFIQIHHTFVRFFWLLAWATLPFPVAQLWWSPLVTGSWKEAIEEKGEQHCLPCCACLRCTSKNLAFKPHRNFVFWNSAAAEAEPTAVFRPGLPAPRGTQRTRPMDRSHRVPQVRRSGARSSSQLLPRGCQWNFTHRWTLSHPAAYLYLPPRRWLFIIDFVVVLLTLWFIYLIFRPTCCTYAAGPEEASMENKPWKDWERWKWKAAVWRRLSGRNSCFSFDGHVASL